MTAANREPRRIARQGWDHDQHLGELDADVDELHILRERDQILHKADMKALNGRFDRLIAGVWGLFLVGLGAVATFVVGLLTGRLGA